MSRLWKEALAAAPEELVDIEHGTPEWEDARADFLPASLAPGLFGKGFVSRKAIVRWLAGYGLPDDIHERAIAYGYASEAMGRAVAAEYADEDLPSACFKRGWLWASLDGLGDSGLVWENKCLGERTRKYVDEHGLVDLEAWEADGYHYQVAQQLFVTGKTEALITFTSIDGDEQARGTWYLPEGLAEVIAMEWEKAIAEAAQMKSKLAEDAKGQAAAAAKQKPVEVESHLLPIVKAEGGVIPAEDLAMFHAWVAEREAELDAFESTIEKPNHSMDDFAVMRPTIKVAGEIAKKFPDAIKALLSTMPEVAEVYATMKSLAARYKTAATKGKKPMDAWRAAVTDAEKQRGADLVAHHIRGLEDNLGCNCPLPFDAPDWDAIAKNWRDEAKLAERIDGAVAEATSKLTALAPRVGAAAAAYDEVIGEYADRIPRTDYIHRHYGDEDFGRAYLQSLVTRIREDEAARVRRQQEQAEQAERARQADAAKPTPAKPAPAKPTLQPSAPSATAQMNLAEQPKPANPRREKMHRLLAGVVTWCGENPEAGKKPPYEQWLDEAEELFGWLS